MRNSGTFPCNMFNALLQTSGVLKCNMVHYSYDDCMDMTPNSNKDDWNAVSWPYSQTQRCTFSYNPMAGPTSQAEMADLLGHSGRMNTRDRAASRALSRTEHNGIFMRTRPYGVMEFIVSCDQLPISMRCGGRARVVL